MTDRIRRIAWLALATAVFTLPAGATVRIQKEAKELQFPAGNCAYCHTFDSDHMMAEAKRLNLPMRNLDCAACHGRRLPKSGPAVLNARGQWLVAEKRRLKAERVDTSWLSRYVEPSSSPTPGPKPKRRR